MFVEVSHAEPGQWVSPKLAKKCIADWDKTLHGNAKPYHWYTESQWQPDYVLLVVIINAQRK